jgi:hypothetical protein
LYQELVDRDLLEVSNETAAAAMKTVAVSDIVVSDATQFMRQHLLWYWSSPDAMSGAIQTGLDDGTLVQLQEALGELWSSLFGQSTSLLHVITKTDIAIRIYDGWKGMIALGVVTEDQMVDFYDLGHGLMFVLCTAADVQEAKDLEAERIALEQAEIERQERSSALMMEYEQASNDAGVEEALYEGDKPALIVALRDTADSLEG